MLKKLFLISVLTIVVVGLLTFGSPATKASADSADNLANNVDVRRPHFSLPKISNVDVRRPHLSTFLLAHKFYTKQILSLWAKNDNMKQILLWLLLMKQNQTKG